MPIGGVDGTIANRMKGTPAQGNVHAKTGTVDRSHALSGYVTTADGKMLLFSFQANNYTVANTQVERVQDWIAAMLAGSPLWKWPRSGRVAGVTRRGRRTSARSALGTFALVFVLFFCTSGGPYTTETLVHDVGPGLGLLILLAVPIVWSIPEALIV